MAVLEHQTMGAYGTHKIVLLAFRPKDNLFYFLSFFCLIQAFFVFRHTTDFILSSSPIFQSTLMLLVQRPESPFMPSGRPSMNDSEAGEAVAARRVSPSPPWKHNHREDLFSFSLLVPCSLLVLLNF
jgi:hypothetical protein